MYYMCKYVCIWDCCYVYLIHVCKNGKLFKMADMQMKCLYRKKYTENVEQNCVLVDQKVKEKEVI